VSELTDVIADFTSRLSAVIEAEALIRVRASVLSAFSGGEAAGTRRLRRPPRVVKVFTSPATSVSSASKKRPRKKAPLQLCPVPGCKNPAAPVFGMVCAKHKDLPKTKIKKYREARRAKKLAAKK
jgi:hypothetical protein